MIPPHRANPRGSDFRERQALTQSCQERDPAIGKLQRIVMHRNLIFVDLPKDRCLMLDYLIAPGYQARG